MDGQAIDEMRRCRLLGQMTVQELGNHAVQRVVGLYSTSSLRSVRDVRMGWFYIGKDR